jgi:hypothetical protein
MPNRALVRSRGALAEAPVRETKKADDYQNDLCTHRAAPFFPR